MRALPDRNEHYADVISVRNMVNLRNAFLLQPVLRLVWRFRIHVFDVRKIVAAENVSVFSAKVSLSNANRGPDTTVAQLVLNKLTAVFVGTAAAI
jgi:hypothetical protein